MSNSPHIKKSIRRGYSGIKTPIKHNLTTKSRPVKSSYLEIFIMDKHRSRLKQERANLSDKIYEIDKELASLDKAIALMGRDVGEDIGFLSPPATAASLVKEVETIKRMTFKY